MENQRAQKKSYKQSLENIKEKIKEKRARRLCNLTSRKKNVPKNTAAPSKASLILSLQQNNKDLAAALQAEKENSNTANDIIYRLKKENAMMLWHIAMLKRELRLKATDTPSDILVQSQENDTTSSRRSRVEVHDEPLDKSGNGEPSKGSPEEKENSNLSSTKRNSRSSINNKCTERTFPKRRHSDVVTYAEPSLKVKLRRGDKFTDRKFVSSVLFGEVL